MRPRIVALLALALVAAACLMFSGYWASVLASAAAERDRDRAEYNGICWLVAFGVCAGAWIWLLVKTVRRNRAEEQL